MQLDWYRSPTGEWAAMVPDGFYVIRGGPGAWWFARIRSVGGVTLATGPVRGGAEEAKADAEAHEGL